jgi:predicted DCC family thiol-disulfide oxidoreductase YuxK
MEKPILLFDGICNVCNASVDFVLKNDNSRSILFCSLQSEKGKELLRYYQMNAEDLTTVVLIDKGKVYIKSDAILRTAKIMGFPWNLSQIFFIVPRFLRDYLYTKFAANRYKWFGKKETCRIPITKEKQRFIQ